MSWIILEGVDRVGKTTVAKLFEKKGFTYVHLKSPDKKYYEDGYVGPSYLDELTDMYIKYSNQDVVFDRSARGECVWPAIFNRKPLLTEEDLEILTELETQNQAQYILMYDSNVEAHWARCVANKEPITRAQLTQASILYERLVKKYGFVKKQLPDFGVSIGYLADEETLKKAANMKTQTITQKISDNATSQVNLITSNVKLVPQQDIKSSPKTTEQLKLERANAINNLLSSKILKKTGGVYDNLEAQLRSFLKEELSTILGGVSPSGDPSLSRDEVDFIRLLVKNSRAKTEIKR